MLTQTAYVLQEIGYEYNDEYYYRGESGGGEARAVYFDRALAQKECDARNLASLKTIDISYYSECPRDLFSAQKRDRVEEIFERYDASLNDPETLSPAFARMTLAEQQEISDEIHLAFFEVVEAPVLGEG